MKRKDLYNYIKEEIVGALTEVDLDKTSGSVVMKKGANPSDIKKLTSQGIDVELKELANVVSIIKIQDPAKFALAKEIYTSGRTGALLTALEAAGDEGMTQKALGAALGLKNDSELNPIISNLRTAGVLTPKREKAVKPEKTEPETEPELPTLSPEEEPEEEPIDTWEKPEEEETPEEEPTVANDKELEKTVGKAYAELSPEEEKLYNTFKTAITNKAKVLNDKKASDADKAKAKAAIDSYKTKEDVKKVFAKRGLKLIDFINGELNK